MLEMKRKIGNYNCNVSSEQDQNKLMKLENNRCSWSLTPILSDEYYKKVDTELVYVAEILDKKEASRLVKELSQAYPIPNLIHLKRVRCRKKEDSQIMDIILLPVNETSNDLIEQKIAISTVLSKPNINLQGLAEYGSVIAVPKTSPLTRKQYEAAMVFWPTQFHEDKYTAKVLNDELFNEKDKNRIEFFMRTAIEAAEETNAPAGALIVNPSTNTIICKAVDLRRKHPLQHAVMVAVDLVSKSQGGGAWDLNAPQLYAAQRHDENNKKTTASTKNGPYLCTGYDLYLTREPCMMCAMALVHCRIRRVFYGCSTTWGKLGTCMKLHRQNGLNHHFEVWKGILETECRALSESYDIR